MPFWGSLAAFASLSLGAAAAGDVDAVLACRAIVAAEARLACFDRTSADLAGVEVGAAAPAAARDVAPTADPDFGLPEKPAEGATAALAARVVSVERDTFNRRVFALDNGQVWRQLEAAPLSGLKAGAAVEIAASGYGGFRLTVEGYQAVTSVKRLK